MNLAILLRRRRGLMVSRTPNLWDDTQTWDDTNSWEDYDVKE